MLKKNSVEKQPGLMPTIVRAEVGKKSSDRGERHKAAQGIKGTGKAVGAAEKRKSQVKLYTT